MIQKNRSIRLFIATALVLNTAYSAYGHGQELPLEAISLAEKSGEYCQILLGSKSTSEFQKTLAQLDLKEFAKQTTYSGQDNLLRLKTGTLEAYFKTSQSAKLRDTILEASPWVASLLPFEEYRRIAFDHIFAYLNEERTLIKLPSRITSWKEMESVLNKPLITSTNSMKDVTFIRDVATKLRKIRHNITPSDKVIATLCGTYGSILHISSCIESLKGILNDMAPTRSPNIVLIDEIENFFLNDRLGEGVRIAAQRILKLVQSGEIPEHSLFDELYTSFLKSGLEQSKSYEATWQLLGISASGGPSTGMRNLLPFSQGIQMGAARYYPYFFTIIGLGSSVLDSRTLTARNRFFSYPTTVHSTVESSKNYHFWMSAYLSRKYTLKTGNEVGAAAATWLSQLGYQMKSGTSGRDPQRAFKIPAFAPANNKIRLDLAYAANGVIFGTKALKSLTTVSMNIDRTFKKLLESGENLPPLPDEEVSAIIGPNKNNFSYDPGRRKNVVSFQGKSAKPAPKKPSLAQEIQAWLRWRRIFSPNSAMQDAKSTIK